MNFAIRDLKNDDGRYMSSTNTIAITPNTFVQDGKLDVILFLSAISHEYVHHTQWIPSTPLAWDPQSQGAFDLNKKAYISPNNNIYLYQRQPLELPAQNAGEAVRNKLMDVLRDKGAQ
jgi:hypothetical protein